MDFMELVAMLSWWAGVVLAVLSYLLLHKPAVQPIAAATQPGQMSAMVRESVRKGHANVGQYVVPILCLAGADASAWQRKVPKRLGDDVAQSKASDALDGMSWREFEMLEGEVFRLQGNQVVETEAGSADGGVDLVLTKPTSNGGEKLLVQFKQRRAHKVGVDVVREHYGVMAARGATGGFVVTSGRFTDEAISFASGRNVTVFDGPKLRGLLQQARASASSFAPASPATPSPAQTKVGPVESPTSPSCSKPTVRRAAKRGASAGGEFWGCTVYPACRGTRKIG